MIPVVTHRKPARKCQAFEAGRRCMLHGDHLISIAGEADAYACKEHADLAINNFHWKCQALIVRISEERDTCVAARLCKNLLYSKPIVRKLIQADPPKERTALTKPYPAAHRQTPKLLIPWALRQ